MPNDYQLKMFDFLSTLADVPTYKRGSRDGYIAIGITPEKVPNTNAVTIQPNETVSFFTHNSELATQARSIGLSVKEPPGRVKFLDITINDVHRNTLMFKQLVNNSIAIVTERRSTKGSKSPRERS